MALLQLTSLCRYADLECIHSQFKSSKVTKMAELLDAMESSYYPAFKDMLQDVLAGKLKPRFNKSAIK